MTLDQLRFGQRARVIAITGGRGLQRRLQQIGIHPGDTVSLAAQGSFRGPILITINGTRLALGRGVARRIRVEPV